MLLVNRIRPLGILDTINGTMHEEVFDLLESRKGHFLLESGHHGDLWLDLEVLFHKPALVQSLAVELGRRIGNLNVDAVCGPLVEGAFLAVMVAAELDVDFIYTERFERPSRGGIFPVDYRIPNALRGNVHGKRVAIVNDVINAGSAVRGTFADLDACGAVTVGIAALLVLGSPASIFAANKNVVLETIASEENRIWEPDDCPLCAAGVPLNRL